jgi:hypothetical protein
MSTYLPPLLEISFTPYVPTTLLGLFGLVAAYLYFFFTNRDNNRLQAIKSTPDSDRLAAIETFIGELGVPIPTGDLTPGDKYKLLLRTLRTKERKWVIMAILCVIIAALTTFLIYNNERAATVIQPHATDTAQPVIIQQHSGKGDNVVNKYVTNATAPTTEKKAVDSLSILPAAKNHKPVK